MVLIYKINREEVWEQAPSGHIRVRYVRPAVAVSRYGVKSGVSYATTACATPAPTTPRPTFEPGIRPSPKPVLVEKAPRVRPTMSEWAWYVEQARLGRIRSRTYLPPSYRFDTKGRLQEDKFVLYLKKRTTLPRYTKRGILRDSGVMRRFRQLRKVIPEETRIPEPPDEKKIHVPPREARKIKKRVSPSSFHTPSQEGVYVPPRVAPPRSAELIAKLRVKCALLKAARLPGSYRMTFFARCLAWAESVRSTLPQEIFHSGEAQGLFNWKIGLNDDTKKVVESAIENLQNSVKDVASAVNNKIVTGISAAAGILVTAAAGGTRASWITGILATLAVTGIIASADICTIGTYFTTAAATKPESTSSSAPGNAPATPLENLEQNEAINNCASGLTLLFQTIGLYCGVAGDLSHTKEKSLLQLGAICSKNLQFNARSTVGLFNFFKNFMSILKTFIKWLYEKANPNMAPIIAFWEHSTVCRELFKLCNTLQQTQIEEFSDPNKLAQLESCIHILTEITVRINAMDQNTHSAQLFTWCCSLKDQLLKISAECRRKGFSVVCKQTPYVVYIYGDSGVGKSTVLNDLAQDVAMACGVPKEKSNYIYTRPQGLSYIDGFGDQQIMLYDDFAQFRTTDPNQTDVAELFQLCTDQPFRPNMAALNEKGRILDIKLVLIASNFPFPKANFVEHPEALWRRRNVLVKAEAITAKPSKNDPFDPTYQHLRFRIHDNVTVEGGPSSPQYTFEQLKRHIVKDAKLYVAAEKSRLDLRLARIQETTTETRTNPLTVEALEALLVNSLHDRNSTDPFHKMFNVADNIKRIKQWLRQYLPFMYDPNIVDEAQQEVEEHLDTALAIKELKTIEIQDGNFLDFLHNKETWDMLSTDQQTKVKEFWKLHYPNAPFLPPRPRCAPDVEASAEANAGEPKQTDSKSNDKSDGLESEKAEFDAWGLCYEEHFKKSLEKQELMPPRNTNFAMYQLLKSFNMQYNVSPVVHGFIHIYCGIPSLYPLDKVKQLITKIRNCKCEHAAFNFQDPSHTFTHCAVSAMTNMYTAKRCTYMFFKCEDTATCLLSIPEYIHALKYFSKALYNDLKSFQSDRTTHDEMKIPENRLVFDTRPYYKVMCKWLKAVASKVRFFIPVNMKWLWTLIKWLLKLLIPIGSLLVLIFAAKSWGNAKEDGSGTVMSTVKHTGPHMKQQLYDLYPTRGKSLFCPYNGISDDSQAAYTVVPRQPSGTNVVQSHIGNANAQDPSLLAIFNKATSWLYVDGQRALDGTTAHFNLRCFKLGAHYVIFPKHYITYMNTLNQETMLVKYSPEPGKFIDINFKSLKLVNVSDSEMIIACILTAPRARDLRKHFASETLWNNAPVPAHMVILEQVNDILTVHNIHPKLIHNFTLTCFNDAMITLPEVLAYDWGGAGRCMSIIVDDQNKIRGFHIAGNSKIGYGQIVTADLLAQLGNLQDPPQFNFVNPDGVPSIEIDTNVHHVGVVEAKYAIHQPTTTAIRRSDIHGVFPVRTIPAPLRPCEGNQYTEPLKEGVRKHGLPTLGFDQEDMLVAEQRFTEMLVSRVEPIWSDVKVRSMDLAIRGVEGVQSFKSMVLNTSEGFPYMCNRPKGQSSKRWLIHQHIEENNEIVFGLHDSLIENYNTNMAIRKNNEIPPTVFVDCLKDARLPIEKAFTPGKVRIFSVAPTDFVIAFRQYFADFIVSYTHARFDAHHAIGIAAEKDDWTDLVRHLSVVGNKFLCGDYKNFGPGFDHGVHKAVYRAIIEWYNVHTTTTDALALEEEQTVRQIMHIELSEPTHIAGNVLYRTFSGMCSGSPSTTIDNSCVNTFYIILAWFAIFKDVKPLFATYDAMCKHLRFVTYGDDIIMCVSDDAIEYFNNVTLSSFFAKYGITYTDALKTGQIRPWCHLADATFLKRNFIPHPYNRNTFLGALEKISIEDCANWINKTIDTRSASIEASYACLQLAYGWGPEYFAYVRDKLMKAWRERRVIFTPRTWADYERIYRECDPVRMSVYTGEANGPPTSTPGESTQCEDSMDTVIQDHAPPDAVCPTITQQRIIDWAGADYDASYERLLNRYVLLETFKWSTTDGKSKTLQKKISDKVTIQSIFSLPIDAISKNIDTPTMLPFLQHRYTNVDMKIKVIANVNKFMVGRLLISWYYLHKEDAGYKFRHLHVYSQSHLLHCEIDAGSSNTAEMCIPYKNYRPWIHVHDSQDLGVPGVLGQLRITVLSPLNVPSTSNNSCTVSIFVKFENGSFMGVVPRDLNTIKAEANMLPMLTTMAAAYLLQKNSDANRDKPPVQLPPQHMQPMSSSSLAIGTGCSEPLHAMRLDARGQCPHPDSDSTSMDLINICKQKVYYDDFKWTANDEAGKQLWREEVTPTIARERFEKVTLRGGKEPVYGYVVPPVSVIAGLMSAWRGSLEFSFDVIGSAFHTGRLAISFLPIITDSITIAQVQSLPYVIFDIHDERSFTYVTPYIADKPWWPCGYKNGNATAIRGIGTLFVHILNPLIPMDSVSNQVDVLVSLAASSSFEVAIPRQSVWGLPWNIDTKAPDSVHARDTYYPWYVSTWREVASGTRAVLRYGATTDHIAQFDGLKFGVSGASGGWCYYVLDDQDPNYEANAKVTFNSNIKLSDCAFIPINDADGWGTIYLGAILRTKLKIGKGQIWETNYDKEKQPNYPALQVLTEDSSYVVGNPALTMKLIANLPTLRDMEYSSDGNIQVCETTPTVKSTGCGMELFGEAYNDGKDYLRRYEPLFRVPVDLRKKDREYYGKYAVSFDVLPAGYDVPFNNPYAQTSRDGGQAIVASAFRFYRGSMNFKFIANSPEVNMYFEHRPDREFASTKVRPAGITDRDTKWAKNYASTVGIASVNQIITLNIPFYQIGTLGLLQRPATDANLYAKRAYSLGEILIGVEPNPAIKNNDQHFIDIFRAIGDDMRFYTYTGFPCLIYIGDIISS